MKILHLWRENELFEINFEFKLKKPATKQGFILDLTELRLREVKTHS